MTGTFNLLQKQKGMIVHLERYTNHTRSYLRLECVLCLYVSKKERRDTYHKGFVLAHVARFHEGISPERFERTHSRRPSCWGPHELKKKENKRTGLTTKVMSIRLLYRRGRMSILETIAGRFWIGAGHKNSKPSMFGFSLSLSPEYKAFVCASRAFRWLPISVSFSFLFPLFFSSFDFSFSLKNASMTTQNVYFHHHHHLFFKLRRKISLVIGQLR